MKRFPCGHATHPQWRMAAGLAIAQLRAQMALPDHASTPRLGLLYITDHYARQAQELLDHVRAELPQVTDWVGTTGVGICAPQAEYWDEPALVILLCDLPPEHYRVFSGLAPLPVAATGGWQARTALVHVEAQTPELDELILELAQRTSDGMVFGGLASARGDAPQFAVHGGQTGGCFVGGLSGVAFSHEVACMTRLTQGCQPVGVVHTINRADDLVVLELDGEPALDVMLRELEISLDAPQRAIDVVRKTLAGLSLPQQAPVGRTGHLQQDVRVRHIVGLDPMRQGIALAEHLQTGMGLVFCRRDPHTARTDLTRICAELREALDPEMLPLESALTQPSEVIPTAPPTGRRIAGAVYVSCTGRGGGHFGGPSAEMQIIGHALGDVPLVGFYASGEIAGHQLYGYTGVLTVFVSD
ncbi:MAG: FIST N-terminal domain-containing protein [Limnohabitans sp.]